MKENKPIKLFLVITKGNFGGAQRYVYDLATGLSQDQYDITVISGEGGILETRLVEKNIRYLKIKGLKRNVSLWADFKSLLGLVRLFRQEKPDIIHLNSSKAAGLGSFAGRLVGVPKIIFTGHGWTFNEKRAWLEKMIILFFHWLTIVFCHQTISVSEKTKDDISHLPFIKKKITVVQNGIDDFSRLDKVGAQEQLIKLTPISPTDLISKTCLSTIAELHQNKGLDIAIAGLAPVLKSRSDLIYLIIGEGEERQNLQKMIEKYGLEKSVFLIGFVAEARKYLSAFDIFLLPSRTEALPYAILEAGLARLPVIASRVGGIPEIIKDGENGLLVKPENPNEVAGAIEKLMDNPSQRTALGENLNQTIVAEFNLDKMIRETEMVYKTNFASHYRRRRTGY